jgi:toxin ParE1/3/4
MAQLRFSSTAQRDLTSIADYIAQGSPHHAARFILRLEEHCQLLANRPLMGRARDEVRLGLRSVRFGRYVIFYRPAEDGAEIVRVIHSARDLDRAMQEE